MLRSNFNVVLFTFLSSIVVCLAGTVEEANNTIESTKSFLFLNYDEIHVREIETRENPVLKDKYNQCGVLYTAAVNALIKSEDSFKAGDYQKLPPLASTALEKVKECGQIFTPPGTETKFKGLNDKAIDVCVKLLDVVKALPPKA